MKKSLAVLCGLTAAGLGQTAIGETALVRMDVRDSAQLGQLEKAGAEPLACRPGTGEQLFAVDLEAMDAVRAIGPAEVLDPDILSTLDAARSAARGGGFFDDYQTFDVINAKLDELAMSARAEIVVVGDTLEGRTVRGLKISGAGAGPKPAVLVNGTQHAREWISPASCMFIADQLINTYGTDPAITDILDKVDFYIVPVTNADGYVYSFTPGNRFWRKNRRPNGGGSFGVDPNRNWAEGWGLSSGSSSSPNSSIFRGPSPFSEPCTANMRDFIMSIPELRAHIDVHSYSQLVLGVWGYTNTDAPDGETLLPLGEAMSDAMIAEHGSFYDARTGDGGIGLASGIMPDWTFGELGIMGWTFELRDQGQNGFVLPVSQLIPAAEEAMAGVMRLADQLAHCPQDLNLDGIVDAGDLAIMLTRWSNTRGLADSDLSGTVGGGDLAGLLAAWGMSCP